MTPLSMPSKDENAQKANRERLMAEKEERRRLGRERIQASEIRARRKSSTEFRRIDVAIEVNPTPVGLMEVEEKEEMEEDTFHGAPTDAKRRMARLSLAIHVLFCWLHLI